MTQYAPSRHDERSRPASHRNWPRPEEIRHRAQRIRREWSDGEYCLRERLAQRRLRQLAEQLLG
ncbi:MAG TPA: hypothetical protein VGX76_12440 [Pirellulales bacterium]|jgi:hypothetical protein|nr:hypothetical protein [Pirellulales bacterium]